MKLYGKPGCHLCDDAREVLHEVLAGRQEGLEEVDITLDPAVERRYRERVPVIVVDGVEVFDYFVDRDRLIEVLDGSDKPGGTARDGR